MGGKRTARETGLDSELERIVAPEGGWPATPDLPPLPRRKPRVFVEWQALREWGKLAPGEESVWGYRLRALREECGVTQAELARRLGCTQQAVSRAERWQSNPTLGFVAAWAEALGRSVELGWTSERSTSVGNSAEGGRSD
ncbi:MAG: XRE family transcriptional regulator [Acidobacteria bacterium]|nr:MAG: XRE family transcriptional regulator [Acidobacteriota bacterium]REK08562.1 MAG: XRE family transcriptional regulator [Acidobacteriota bacterium]